jgi:ADP-heptose:LPS heptosyltransferase
LVSQTDLRDGVLVVFPGALGDLVCFLPALRAIASSHARRVTVVCKGELAALVRLAGPYDAMPIEGRASSWLFSAGPPREADAFFGRFDALHSFSGAGVMEVERNVARWFGERGFIHPFRSRESAHAALHFLRSAGHDGDVLPSADVAVPPAFRERARTLLGQAVNNRPLLLVHPGSGGKSKRWSSSGFQALIAAWQRHMGAAAVLLGPAERSEIEQWRTKDTDVIVVDDVVELAALLSEADRYLGNDSGPTHLAAAVGGRGIVLFGPSDPLRWRPLGGTIEVLTIAPWASVDAEASGETISLVWQALTRGLTASSP